MVLFCFCQLGMDKVFYFNIYRVTQQLHAKQHTALRCCFACTCVFLLFVVAHIQYIFPCLQTQRRYHHSWYSILHSYRGGFYNKKCVGPSFVPGDDSSLLVCYRTVRLRWCVTSFAKLNEYLQDSIKIKRISIRFHQN